GDQLRPGGDVDAHETGPLDWRAAHPKMHGRRAGPAQFLHDLPAGGAAHNRVVDEHDALALEDLAQWIELQLDADVAQPLVGLDEGAGDVAALDQPLAEWDAALLGVADRGRRPRV